MQPAAFGTAFSQTFAIMQHGGYGSLTPPFALSPAGALRFLPAAASLEFLFSLPLAAAAFTALPRVCMTVGAAACAR